MRVLILDGHPDDDRLTGGLLDIYAAALPPGCSVGRLARTAPGRWRGGRR